MIGLSPARRGAYAGALIALLTLSVTLGVEALLRRQAARRAADTAAVHARLAAGATAGWLDARRRVTALMAARLTSAGPVFPERTVLILQELRRAWPDEMQAAAIVAGDGQVVAAAEEWRLGTAPAWGLAEPGVSGITWRPLQAGGRFVARAAMIAPADLPAPLWLVTVWGPEGLARALAPSRPESSNRVLLLEAEGEPVLRLPAAGSGPSRPTSRVQIVPGAALQVRVEVQGPAGSSLLPWLLAALLGGGTGATITWRSRRLRSVDRSLGGAIARSGRGGAASHPAAAGRLLPTTLRALEALGQRDRNVAARRTAVESALGELRGAAILVTDTAGVVQLAAGDLLRLLGVVPEEADGKPLRRLLPAAHWAAVAPLLTRVALQAAGDVADLAPCEGRPRLELTVSARGGGSGFTLLLRDVSEARGLEERLQASEARHRSLVEHMQEGLALIREGRIQVANPALAAMLHRQPSELLGSDLREHVAPEDVLLAVERIRAGGTSRFDLRLLPADSLQPLECSVALTPLPEEGAALLMVRDESAARLAERRLRAAHHRLDATLQATSEGILAMDAEGLVMFYNPAFLGIAGLARGQVEAGRGAEVLERMARACQLPAEFDAWSRDVLRHPAGRRTERFQATQPQGARTLEIQTGPLPLPGAAAAGRLLTLRDVSAEAEVERRLRQDQELSVARRQVLEEANRELATVNRELEARTGDLDEVNQKLKHLDEMRSNLLANVSHELQTPLVSVRGYTEMILKGKIGPITPDQERGLEISLKNIDRLIGLIDNLLEFSGAEGGLSELKLTTFPLKDLITENLELLRETAARSAVHMEATYPGGEPLIRADRDRIGQVLVNLLGNAVKFNREGGEVTLSVNSPRRGFVRLDLRDTGAGIPPDALERIFERYYRAERSPDQEVPGSGLGLSITRQILRTHGCTIRATSPQGGGAVFSFTLPLAREDEPPESTHTVQRRRSTEPST